MKNNINIAELLKDCPSGMELDCTMYEDVYFDYVDESNYIRCYTQQKFNKTSIVFLQDGTPNSHTKSKCVIFPKGKTTWEGFQRLFKDGDIVATNTGCWIGITLGGRINSFIPIYCVIKDDGEFEAYFDEKEKWQFNRLATKVEKEKLFNAIKENGYKWNAETRTLEKLIKPKFKVGDKIRHKTNNKDDRYEISKVYDDCYSLVDCTVVIYMEHQDNWELVIEPKFKVGDRITNGTTSITIGYIDDEYYYEIGRNIANRLFIKNQDEWNLVPRKFDITTLKPFESRVLIRDTDTETWRGAFYSHYRSKKFYVINGSYYYYQCIPYEGNENLLGTTDDCDEYFKTWK